MPGALSRWRPRAPIAGAIAIAIAVVAMPAGAGRRRGTDGSVDDAKRFRDGAVGRRDEAEPNHLEETLVDDGALVQRRAAVAPVVRDLGVGSARLGQAAGVGDAPRRA